MKELKQIEIERIRIDGGTQMRATIDQATVDDYAERIEELPPSIAFDDGSNIWLADGFHRLHAHNKAGRKKMLCEVRKGTQREAILFAAGANALHGLRRTNEDKRKAVVSLLSDEEWGKRSAEWIAEQCRVSGDLVLRLRKEVQPDKSRVQTKEGKSYPNTQTPKKETGEAPPKKEMPATTDDGIDPDEFFTKPKPAPESKPEPVKDETGEVITNPKIAELFNRRSEIDELLSLVSKIKTRATHGCDQKDPLYTHLNINQLQADCGNIRRALRFARPYALCPYCGGVRGCKVCGKSGMVGETQYKNYTPEDLKV